MNVCDGHAGREREPSYPIKRLAVLGSTGSIGKSTLEIARQHPERCRVVAMAAGSNAELLAEQIKEFAPSYAAVKDEPTLARLAALLREARTPLPELAAGEEAVARAAEIGEVDIVVAAIVGFAGLRSVLVALKAGKRVALANKESLVAGGALVRGLTDAGRGEVIPVDSEHSALFQLLQGQRSENVERLILTASGGPFLRTPPADFAAISPDQALQHPKWSMGPKISIDSATMVNKALEVIEAHWLFGVTYIDVLVHPQSIVHSLVELVDGTQLAQLSVPDMKGAIAFALMHPEPRLPGVVSRLSLARVGCLEFLPLDEAKFPAVALARRALQAGGAAPAVFNIANEYAVQAFLGGEIRFDQIVRYLSDALERYAGLQYGSFEDLIEINARMRSELRDGRARSKQ